MFKVLSCVAFLIALVTACGDDVVHNTADPHCYVPERISIGNTGYSIVLPEGYYMERDTNFGTYYFKPVTPNENESEAGLYIGSNPDTSAPLQEYTRTTYKDVFLGDTATWTQYVTAKFTQREVFLEKSPEHKIHVFLYTRNPDDLEKLEEMIRSIQ